MSLCICDDFNMNTGETNCSLVLRHLKHFILVPQRDSAGAANKITAGDNITSAYIITRLNDTDPSQRWYLIKDIKNANIGDPADPVYQNYDDNSKSFVSNGVSSGTFLKNDSSPQFLGKLEGARCGDMAFFGVDKNGTIVGVADGTGDLYPIAIAKNTWAPKPVNSTATTNYNIVVTFDWDIDVEQSAIRGWKNTVVWTSPSVSGLLDANITIGTVTTTSADIVVTYDYGYENLHQFLRGLVVADFISSVTSATSKIRNTTDSADVTITGVTETAVTSNTWKYTLTWTAQTSGDVLQPFATKQGFDFSNWLDKVITIP